MRVCGWEANAFGDPASDEGEKYISFLKMFILKE
jgi:hypothetical protein